MVKGGVPAFIGFNGGNGTRAYEYSPYSQYTLVRDLPGTGFSNGFPGRHIFRVDEKILPGNCIRDLGIENVLKACPLALFLNILEDFP